MDNAEDKKAMDGQDVSPEEKAQVAYWTKQIEETLDSDQYTKHRAGIVRHRRYVRGVRGENEDERVRTNLIYSTLAASLPYIYAKNPEIAVTPAAAVDQKQLPITKKLARTIEVVLGRQLDDAKLKRRGKSCVRSAQTTGIGWLKVLYQRDIQTDPIIKGRIQDIQDNLQHMQHLIDKCDDDNALQDHERNKAELEQQVAALKAQVEVVRAEGLVIDRILSEDMLVDLEVTDCDGYVDAKWQAHRVWYCEEDYEKTFGCKHDKLTKYSRPKDDAKNGSSKKTYYAVWEIWHKVTNTVYTLGMGAEGWARPPYQPKKLGERWYPFFAIAFNAVDGQFLPMSDVELLEKLQDEYEDTRNEYADVRRKNKPHYLADADTTEKDVVKKTIAGVGEVIIIDGNGKPLDQKFMPAKLLPVDPANYSTDQIRFDAEYVYGMGDAARGSVSKAKTATEAEILQGGMSSRTGERQDVIEDTHRDIAQYSTEIILQEMTLPQVQRLAGPQAVWPQMAKSEVFDMVQIEIRSGTSGKPNKAREQEQWLKFLPGFTDLITKVAELRTANNHEVADALVKIARETIRRFDERIDIDEFLPSGQQQGEAQQQQNQAMEEQMKTMKMEMEKLQAEIRKINSEATLNEVRAGVDMTMAMTGTGMAPTQPPMAIQ